MKKILTAVGFIILAYGTYRAFIKKEQRYIRLN
jgi:ABC-type iron transport system FetAB permease component